MRERPILFSPHMVRAILGQRKSVTRRVVKLPVEPDHRGGWAPCTIGGDYSKDHRGDRVEEFAAIWNQTSGKVISAPYAKGDTLWVREQWRTWERPSDAVDGILFGADNTFVRIENTSHAAELWVVAHNNNIHGEAWRPSIHLPRWAARLFLTVVSVRAERLLAIDDRDATREGVVSGLIPASGDHPELIGYVLGDDDGKCVLAPTPRAAFGEGWEKINGERAPWASDPWVWRIEFERMS